MRKSGVIAAMGVAAGVWLLSQPLVAEQNNYGHCKDEVWGNQWGHSFKSGPTGTVGRTCEGADGLGCHIGEFVAIWACGPGAPTGHSGP